MVARSVRFVHYPTDPHAVVDPGGRVIGSENLYVADASVMPRLPTACQHSDHHDR
jgi:hypothetical protein